MLWFFSLRCSSGIWLAGFIFKMATYVMWLFVSCLFCVPFTRSDSYRLQLSSFPKSSILHLFSPPFHASPTTILHYSSFHTSRELVAPPQTILFIAQSTLLDVFEFLPRPLYLRSSVIHKHSLPLFLFHH
jgi:hypothetical protein